MSSLSTSSPWLTHKISTFIPHTNFWHTFFPSLFSQRVCCGGGAAGGPGMPAAFPDGPKPWGPNDSKLSLRGWGRDANKRRPSGPNRESSVNTVVIRQCHQIQDWAQTVRKKDKKQRNVQFTQGLVSDVRGPSTSNVIFYIYSKMKLQ